MLGTASGLFLSILAVHSRVYIFAKVYFIFWFPHGVCSGAVTPANSTDSARWRVKAAAVECRNNISNRDIIDEIERVYPNTEIIEGRYRQGNE